MNIKLEHRNGGESDSPDQQFYEDEVLVFLMNPLSYKIKQWERLNKKHDVNRAYLLWNALQNNDVSEAHMSKHEHNQLLRGRLLL